MSKVLTTRSKVAELGALLDLSEAGWGASTGYMADARGDWPLLVRRARQVSDTTVELSALSGPELAPLAELVRLPAMLGEFGFVSVHAPAKQWDGSGAELAEQLSAFPSVIQGFVLHPEAFEDLSPFRALGERLWLENMDRRKDDARTVAELARLFSQTPAAQWCFDIAHAAQLDPTMRLANELLEAFGDRLAEVHLSSLEPDGTHVPLRGSDVRTFAPILDRCIHVPWILEAPLPRTR